MALLIWIKSHRCSRAPKVFFSIVSVQHKSTKFPGEFCTKSQFQSDPFFFGKHCGQLCWRSPFVSGSKDSNRIKCASDNPNRIEPDAFNTNSLQKLNIFSFSFSAPNFMVNNIYLFQLTVKSFFWWLSYIQFSKRATNFSSEQQIFDSKRCIKVFNLNIFFSLIEKFRHKCVSHGWDGRINK